jgi:glycosyltransferase involved in cell wall biosynthesis
VSAHTPVVSVVMSALNAAPTVADAVASLRAQSLQDWELIFLDDGSTDGTGAIVAAIADPRVCITCGEKHLGVSARLNQGIAQARARYIARLDADDIAYPERLERQVTFLESHPEIDLIGAAAIVFSDRLGPIGVFRGPTDHAAIAARPEVGFPLAAPTWLGRRAWFGNNPYWDTAIRAEDQGLLLRRSLMTCYANLPQILVGYRQDPPRVAHVLRGRWDYLRQLLAIAVENRDPVLALSGIGTQMGRGAITVALVGAGQGEAVLRHRFSPATGEELDRWQTVHASVRHLSRV